jgi:hypothetical protein
VNNSLITHSGIAAALEGIRRSLSLADDAFWRHDIASSWDAEAGDGELVNFYVNRAFVQALALFEAIGMHRTRELLLTVYADAKKEGLSKSEMGPEDPYLVWTHSLAMYLDVVASTFGTTPEGRIEKDVVSILRAAVYSITDPDVFPSPPVDEDEVHRRVEGVLKCVFPDLLRKPRFTKPIKSFEPDTGLPSIRTVVEYKFIGSKDQVGPIADEILADTRGYASKDYDHFIYAIYETQRFRTEADWNQLLRESGVGPEARVVVLGGWPATPGSAQPRRRTGRPKRSEASASEALSFSSDDETAGLPSEGMSDPGSAPNAT